MHIYLFCKVEFAKYAHKKSTNYLWTHMFAFITKAGFIDGYK